MKVYLAGPDVFYPDPKIIGANKVLLCRQYGLEGLFPLDNAIDPPAARPIFLANQQMMDAADAIVANLTPFRGPSADAGTVYELGYMIGRGKRALGYCNDPTLYVDRVARGGSLKKVGEDFQDEDELLVENFGGIDNLMITESLATRGCPVVVPARRPADPLRNLAGFERCLQILARVAAR